MCYMKVLFLQLMPQGFIAKGNHAQTHEEGLYGAPSDKALSKGHLLAHLLETGNFEGMRSTHCLPPLQALPCLLVREMLFARPL